MDAGGVVAVIGSEVEVDTCDVVVVVVAAGVELPHPATSSASTSKNENKANPDLTIDFLLCNFMRGRYGMTRDYLLSSLFPPHGNLRNFTFQTYLR